MTASSVPPSGGQSGPFTKADYTADDIYVAFQAQTVNDNPFGETEVIFGTRQTIRDKVNQIAGTSYTVDAVNEGIQSLYKHGADWYAATISRVGPGPATHKIKGAAGKVTVVVGNLYMLLGKNQPVTDVKNELLFKGTLGWVKYMNTLTDRMTSDFELWRTVMTARRLQTRRGRAQAQLYDDLIYLFRKLRTETHDIESRIQTEFPDLYGAGNGNGNGTP